MQPNVHRCAQKRLKLVPILNTSPNDYIVILPSYGRIFFHFANCRDMNSNLDTAGLKIFRGSVCLKRYFNTLKAELNPTCYLLALLAHHFLHVSRIRDKSLTLRLLMSYTYIYIY